MANGVEGCATLVWVNRAGTRTQEIRETKPPQAQTTKTSEERPPQKGATDYQYVDARAFRHYGLKPL